MTPVIPDDVEKWTAKKRQEIVLQLLRAETTIAEAAQKYGLPAQEIEEWLAKTLAAMEKALSSSPQDEAEQDYLRDLAMIGLLYGESGHHANNHLGMAKTLAANIREGHYDSDPEKIKSFAEKILNHIDVYLGVLEQSRVEGFHKADNVIVDLHKLLDQVTHSKRIPAWIAIHTDFRASDPRIKAPLKQLQQIFLVLLQNAVEAIIDTNRADRIISISTDEHNFGEAQTIEVSISNAGRAIPLELSEDLFSYSEASRSTSQGQRLGLGLAWVQSFLHIHGGKITYETSDDRDITFHLYLPKTFKAKLG